MKNNCFPTGSRGVGRCRHAIILAVILSFAFAAKVTAQGDQTTINVPIDTYGNIGQALLHLPDDYSSTGTMQYPLLLFFHGMGEAGNDLSKIYNNSSAGGPAYFIAKGQFPASFTNPKDGKAYKFIVISPQDPNQWAFTASQVNIILADLLKRYRIDTNRMYVTGLSMGGQCLWNWAAHYGAVPNHLVAAMVPMSAATVASWPDAYNVASDKIHAWGFGSMSDIWGINTQKAIDSLNKYAPGFGRFTSYQGGHCCWNQFYTPSYKENIDGKSMNIYEWMLQFSRGTSQEDTGSSQPPVANAGKDTTITLPLELINLNGSASSDAGGNIVSYSWEQVSGPAAALILSPTTVTTAVSGLVPGEYVFALTVKNEAGQSSSANITITVNPAPVPTLAVNAGSDQELSAGTASASLAGSGTGGAGTLSYAWTKLSGPTCTITAPDSAATEVTGLSAGNTYTFRLTITDSLGTVATDDINVTVDAYQGIPPLGSQKIVKVGAGEYLVSYLTDQGRVYVDLWNSSTYVPTDIGLSRIAAVDGGQYTNVALDSSGNVFIYGPRLATFMHAITRDINNNSFTGISNVYGWAQTDNSGGGDFPCTVAIKNGEVWIWGKDMLKMNGSSGDISAPTKLNTPSGKKFVKLALYAAGYNAILGLASDGTVWQYRSDSKDPATAVQISFPDAAIDITTISSAAFVVETTTDLYAWGGHGEYLGAGTLSTKPVSVKSYWTAKGVVFPTKELVGGTNTLHLIDQNDNLFAEGDNAQGEIGNGDQINPWRSYTANGKPAPFAWDFGYAEKLVGVTQIPGKCKNIQTGPTFTYYNYVQDMGGNWYSWGRNKALVLGNGRTRNSNDQSTYPDWENVPAPTPVTPLTTRTVLVGGGSYTGASNFNPNTVQDPLANAGINQYNVKDSTILYGQGSSQQDGTLVSYSWSQVSGPNSPKIIDPSSINTSVTGLIKGEYVFSLTVKNNKGVSASANVTVVVNDAAPQAPIADAGQDITITYPTLSASLDGSGSYDPDGKIISYNWEFQSGPTGTTIQSPQTAKTAVTFQQAGEYVFRLTVGDSSGITATDSVKVTVKDEAPVVQPPVADGGDDITISLPVNSATLDGTASKAESGSIVSYTWQFVSGPSQYNILNPDSARATIENLVAGTYVFSLTVKDTNGDTATTNVKITVNTASNQAPIANAGPDTTITLPQNSITLDGTASNDPDGSIVSYTWQKISGPTDPDILNADTAVTVVNNLVAGTYVFSLTVKDNNDSTATANVTIIVNRAPNLPPVANAGPDTTITLPQNSITLDGTASNDPDGSIISYTWQKISGPADPDILNADTAVTVVNNLVAGTYVFSLTVKDNNDSTATANVTIIVNRAPNLPPVANAGPDTTITLPQNSITLNGTASNDPDGSIVSYTWRRVSGPSQYHIQNSRAASTVVNNLVAGTYVFSLRVRDDSSSTAIDSITITVNPAPNLPPVANAGNDQTITLPEDSIILNGIASSDRDGNITSYSWEEVSGPSQFNIQNAGAVTTVVNDLVAGTYVFSLTVKDNKDSTATDSVTVTVNPAPNQLPVADAGNTIIITAPASSATLDGSGSRDPDGTIAGYQWTMVSGQGKYTFADSLASITQVNDLETGKYIFNLTVTDNEGAASSTTVTVIVNPEEVTPPTADAGQDVSLTLPEDSTVLDGSASKGNGTTLAAYNWNVLSGPSQYAINDKNAAQTVISGLVQGVYVIQLTVTDDNGATSVATVTLTVNPAPNQSPVADAGQDQTITLPLNYVTLNGAASKDPDGTIVSYNWKKTSGPAQFNIQSPNAASTAVSNLEAGTYTFVLSVSDNSDAIAMDSVIITVNPAPNQPPVANTAGSNQIITLPLDSVILDGSASQDPDGSIKSYNWQKISGPAGFNIQNADAATTIVRNLEAGTYVFSLTVTDNNDSTATASVTVTVEPALNQPPLADAGSNQTITLPLDSVILNGSASKDADGNIVSYAWQKISGPTQFNVQNANAATTLVNNLVAGTYVFSLTVTDNNDSTATASVTVTVEPAPNQPPVADAGSNQTITLPKDSVTLNGSASKDADGNIVSYTWQKISGPAQFNIQNINTATTLVNNLTAGTYIFSLTVKDNNGASDTTNVTVTVNPAPNQPPVASAGSNQTITLPEDSILLNGSASKDADGNIVSYTWRKISGPTQFNILNTNIATTLVNNLTTGTYVFSLTVKDNSGATDTANVTITVNPAPNQLPVANAGSGQIITLPKDSVTLNGSASRDPDGSIISYTWKEISGPAQFTIQSPNAATTRVNNLAAGTYVFSLTVKDNQGAVASSNVTIKVNAVPNKIPLANAGKDITITLPDNSITLDGSASVDEDGSIISYRWTKISGPGSYVFADSLNVLARVNSLTAGKYVFQLTVTDDNKAKATATVTVTVNPAPNQPPVANAGSNQTITLPTNSITLNGSASKDADGSIINYTWQKISGPAQFNIQNANSVTTLVNNLTTGTYVFSLTVKDNKGATATANVSVIVKPAPNQPPVANAGSNQTISLPVSSVTLNGAASKDADGSIASYTWQKISGPDKFTIQSPNTVSTVISNLGAGTYIFSLTVKDNNGATATDSVIITVKAAEGGSSTAGRPTPNQTPVANAGSNQTITLPKDSVILNGTGSADPDGNIASYTWQKISGPAQFNIQNANAATTVVNNLAAGTYVFSLTVKDNNGASDTINVTITVKPAPNQPPVANAGSDQTITLPKDSVILNGSASKDADGNIVEYSWTKISGPADVLFSNAASVKTVVNNLKVGTYLFKLTVTDNQQATGDDTVAVIVKPVPNKPPVANAGADTVLILPAKNATLSGSGSYDPDGQITGYEWIKVAGPAGYTLSGTNSVEVKLYGLSEGEYIFRLIVTDNNGATATDSVKVTVKSASNIVPVADAGPDTTITLPVNNAVLNGSRSYDPDGHITHYRWEKLVGPTELSMSGQDSAVLSLSDLTTGSYTFELTVTDDKGASMSDQVTVDVNMSVPAASGQVILYPNPAINDVNVFFYNNENGKIGITIYNTSGKAVANYQFTKDHVSVFKKDIDISNLAAGLYVLEIRIGDNYITTRKFIKATN